MTKDALEPLRASRKHNAVRGGVEHLVDLARDGASTHDDPHIACARLADPIEWWRLERLSDGRDLPRQFAQLSLQFGFSAFEKTA